ncbi:MAG TPA: hypothetical protein PLQ88_20565, partial [Blastocatellia bacterium]|nr:hypothetical protein [Blastocatellia bacterium]
FSDNYPIVRFFAAQSLAANDPGLPKPDYLGTDAARNTAFEKWWAKYRHSKTETRQEVFSLTQALRARRINLDIEVGE